MILKLQGCGVKWVWYRRRLFYRCHAAQFSKLPPGAYLNYGHKKIPSMICG